MPGIGRRRQGWVMFDGTPVRPHAMLGRSPMKNRIIAAVTAIALTLTSAAATPAMAQDKGNDALKVLLGAAAIGLLISQANKNKRDGKAEGDPEQAIRSLAASTETTATTSAAFRPNASSPCAATMWFRPAAFRNMASPATCRRAALSSSTRAGASAPSTGRVACAIAATASRATANQEKQVEQPVRGPRIATGAGRRHPPLFP